MTKNDFTQLLTTIVNHYIDDFSSFDSNPQLKINPVLMTVDLINGSEMFTDIEYADEAVEQAVAAESEENEEATDYQASQNPDFYPVKKLLRKNAEGRAEANPDAIAAVAAEYFK